jgi:hypothetical protein
VVQSLYEKAARRPRSGAHASDGARRTGRAPPKGRWLDDKTFELESETVGNDDATQIEFTFDDKSVGGRAATLGGDKGRAERPRRELEDRLYFFLSKEKIVDARPRDSLGF